MKISNEKKLWLKILVDLKYTHTGIDKTKNREVTKFVLLELKINRYIEKINIIVTDLNNTDIFLRYDWLVKHNPEVNWDKEIIQFMRCLREYIIQHQSIMFMSKAKII